MNTPSDLERENTRICPACNGRGGECPHCCNGFILHTDATLAAYPEWLADKKELATLRADLEASSATVSRQAFELKRLDAQLAEAREQAEANLNPVHSCGDHCQRPACVFRRERDKLRAEVERLRNLIQEQIIDSPKLNELARQMPVGRAASIIANFKKALTKEEPKP